MRSLAEQALDNLIDQFARPLDFLRELVQNALDAGSPRIEVHGQVTAEGLVLEVRDTGHGMDRHIIDAQLTRLFASQKAGDRTQIGRFGIGFASVFALRPHRVVVRTGRLDQSWEVRFDADRQFDVVPLTERVVGTTVRVEVHMPADAAERTLREAEWVLGYWCEHTDRPVVFVSEPPSAPQEAPEDPFTAFAAPTPRENTVSRPFSLDAPVTARGTLGDLTVLVGVTDSPRFAFYSHGLTLVNTEDRAVLGEFAERLGHLHIKVAGPGLGHTVTRDNVVHDAQWRRAMERVDSVCADLRQRLVDTIGSAVTRARLPEDETRWLARELTASGESVEPDRPLFLDTSGNARTLAQVAEQEDERSVVLVGEPDCAITQAVCATGDFVLQDSPAVRELLMAVPRSRLMWVFPRRRYIKTARERFWTPMPLTGDALPPVEQEVLRHLQTLAPRIDIDEVVLGDFGPQDLAALEPVAVPLPEERGLVLRQLDTPLKRRLLINRQHPSALTQLAAWHDEPYMVAWSWLHLAALTLDLPAERTDALFQAVRP